MRIDIHTLILGLLFFPGPLVVVAQTQTLEELWSLDEADLVAGSENGVLTMSFNHGSGGAP